MNDQVIAQLLKTNLWILSHKISTDPANVFHVKSHMMGFMDGRYRLEITRLKKRHEGKLYKVLVYYTPYHPYNLKLKSRFDTFEELCSIIKSVNKDLLDQSRCFKHLVIHRKSTYKSTQMKAKTKK